MELKELKFRRKLSRGTSAITLAIPPVLIELLKAQNCQSVFVSIEDDNCLRLEVIRNE